jgi:hypothetical protein
MMTRALIRKARELLGWRQGELDGKREFRCNESSVPGEYLRAIQAALESAGVESRMATSLA